jgi:hypothetical protein
MNCPEFERLAAAAAEDEIERHIAGCEACRMLSEGLRSLREDAVPDAAYVAVRARVLDQVRGERRRWWRWWLGAAAAACAVIVVLLSWRTVTSVAPPPRVALTAPPAPEVKVSVKPPLDRPRRLSRGRHRVQAAVATAKPAIDPAEPLLIKLMTDDPDIVIYWIVEKRGD